MDWRETEIWLGLGEEEAPKLGVREKRFELLKLLVRAGAERWMEPELRASVELDEGSRPPPVRENSM
jgi:hypothetical protein